MWEIHRLARDLEAAIANDDADATEVAIENLGEAMPGIINDINENIEVAEAGE